MSNTTLPISNDAIDAILTKIRIVAKNNHKIAFVSGNFNVLHAGHVRLLSFAANYADVLVVGINADGQSGAMVPSALRLEGLEAVECVNLAFVLPCAIDDFITALKPDFVVKGKEHEHHFNSEQAIVDAYGGQLLFASGEVWFSYLDQLKRELLKSDLPRIVRPEGYITRHEINMPKLASILNKFADLKVVVVGDMIVDEYITCDPVGMSREDPTLVVTPIKRDLFVGGSAIVAAHASSLGGCVNYFSVVGESEVTSFAEKSLTGYGVNYVLVHDPSRPTTLKKRYRSQGKTLLRVSELRQHDISQDLCEKILEPLLETLKRADLLVFSDFNYGCLPQNLVNEIVGFCHKHGIPMAADSQSSSQVGDVSRFHGMMLLTPTEYEARLAVKDFDLGLVGLADELRRKAGAKNVFITLGAEGLLVHSPAGSKNGIATDELTAFNPNPKDPSGAGDCMMICAAMALVAGANVWESAYLGSVAAACQVGKIGNSPLSVAEVRRGLMH